MHLLNRHTLDRGKFTQFSGMGHPGDPNDHGTEPAIFTGVPGSNVRDVRNSISLDQISTSVRLRSRHLW